MTQVVAKGKTKILYEATPVEMGIRAVNVDSQDDLTAGDGKKHDILSGKGALANTTTCNAFTLLQSSGVPVAFYKQSSATSFLAPERRMLTWEVVVRRKAEGSILKRRSDFKKGQNFNPLVVELYLKTSEKKWRNFKLPCDDPLAEFLDDGSARLWKPGEACLPGTHIMVLFPAELYAEPEDADFLPEMRRLAIKAFLILERAWARVGGTLQDFKVEFGIPEEGKLLIADVIDNDSWRLKYKGVNVDKQVYRDGGSLELVLANYTLVAELTEKFRDLEPEVRAWFAHSYRNLA